MNCRYCNKSIRKFRRRNDWKSRPYHLKCWKQVNHPVNHHYAEMIKKAFDDAGKDDKKTMKKLINDFIKIEKDI